MRPRPSAITRRPAAGTASTPCRTAGSPATSSNVRRDSGTPAWSRKNVRANQVTVEDLQIITAADIEAAVRSVCSDNRDMAAIVW